VTLHFLREMERLNVRLINMGNKIESQVSMGFTSVIQLDEAAARRVIRGDVEVDNNEIQMEEECLKLLALYQPVANDLRIIVSVLKINTDLERIGDHASNIAEDVIYMLSGDIIRHGENVTMKSRG
jgi:phosphate transport system protein